MTMVTKVLVFKFYSVNLNII